jgi:cell division protein ZapA (FtsZ GTPase activity inhibitor)
VTLKERVDQHDREIAQHRREIAAIRKLILTGMKMINSLAASQRKTDEQLKSLRSDVQALINSQRRGGNGHVRRKVDLQ